jgi:zinc transporter 1
LINGVFLLALCFTILIDSIERFVSPEPVTHPVLVLITGGVGLLANVVGLFLFHGKAHNVFVLSFSPFIRLLEHPHGHGGHSHNHDHHEEPSSLEAQHHGHSHGHSGHLNMRGVRVYAKILDQKFLQHHIFRFFCMSSVMPWGTLV